MSNIRQELIKVAACKPKKNEAEQDFLKRLVNKVNELEDDVWKTISEPAQLWQNAGLAAATEGNEIPALDDGSEELDPGEGEAGGEPAPAKTAKAKTSTKAASTKEAPVAGKAKAKKAAAKTASKAKTVAKKENGVARGRPGRFPDDAVIKTLRKENPHREGTTLRKVYDIYKPGMTVGQAKAKGVEIFRLAFQVQQGHVKVG